MNPFCAVKAICALDRRLTHRRGINLNSESAAVLVLCISWQVLVLLLMLMSYMLEAIIRLEAIASRWNKKRKKSLQWLYVSTQASGPVVHRRFLLHHHELQHRRSHVKEAVSISKHPRETRIDSNHLKSMWFRLFSTFWRKWSPQLSFVLCGLSEPFRMNLLHLHPSRRAGRCWVGMKLVNDLVSKLPKLSDLQSLGKSWIRTSPEKAESELVWSSAAALVLEAMLLALQEDDVDEVPTLIWRRYLKIQN